MRPEAEWGCGARRRWVAPLPSRGASFRRAALRPVPEWPRGRVIGPWDSRRVKRDEPSAGLGGNAWKQPRSFAPTGEVRGWGCKRMDPAFPQMARARKGEAENRRGGRSVSPPNADYPLGACRAPATPSGSRGRKTWKEMKTRAGTGRENERLYLDVSAAYRTKLRRNSRGVTCFNARNWRLKLARLA